MASILRRLSIILIIGSFIFSGVVLAEDDPGEEAKRAAKIARLKAKQRHTAFEEGGGDPSSLAGRSGGVVGECGSVNVGNVVNDKNTKNTKTEVTVVITGDVINTNTKCNKK